MTRGIATVARGEVKILPRRGDPAVDWLSERVEQLLRSGDVDAALPCLERLTSLARDPDVGVAARLLLGELLREREEGGRSIVQFRAAADLAPERADVLLALGMAHVQQENNRAAVDALRRALILAPRDPGILRALGVALASIGEDAEASTLLDRALSLAPRDVLVLESAASHALKMGRFRECAEILRQATGLAPDNRLIRRLTKEAGYLVELASSSESRPAGGESSGHRLRVALGGSEGEVERLLMQRMREDGFEEPQLVKARDLWRDFLEVKNVRVRRPAEHAAAIHHAIARLDFVDGCARDRVAERYSVPPESVARLYREVVASLDLAVFDPRYSSQPNPVTAVGNDAKQADLTTEEVFRALLEDEYREYEETHSRLGSLQDRLAIDEFEDASIEYGSLLTRELMGLTLNKRDRRRRRELEKMLLVT